MRDLLRERDLAEAANVQDCRVDVDESGVATITLSRDGLDRVLSRRGRDREYYVGSSAMHCGAS